MTKRQLLKKIKSEYIVEKRKENSYDIVILLNGKKIYVKILNISLNTILSLNSKYVWELKKGKISGIRFITYSSNIINLKDFMKKENKVVILTKMPYKIFRQINESDIEDVTNEKLVNNVLLITNPHSIYDFFK